MQTDSNQQHIRSKLYYQAKLDLKWYMIYSYIKAPTKSPVKPTYTHKLNNINITRQAAMEMKKLRKLLI